MQDQTTIRIRGRTMTLPPAAADYLCRAKVAERVEDEPKKPNKRRYRRKDMRAEES